MSGADKMFRLATGESLHIRIRRRTVTATATRPNHMHAYPTGQVTCQITHVRTFADNPARVYFDKSFLDTSVAEAEAIVSFVRGTAR